MNLIIRSNRMPILQNNYHNIDQIIRKITAETSVTFSITPYKTYHRIGPHNIKSSEQEKLLEALIDNKLTFDKHINNLCSKASQKLNALC